MSTLEVAGLTGLGTVASLGAAAVVLLLSEQSRQRLLPLLLAFAAGTLLTSALLGMLPHALEHGDANAVLGTMLAALVAMFLFERLVLLRHCHDDRCQVHSAAAALVLIGDGMHNFVDGVAIAVACSVSTGFGIATALSVTFHEIPQEIGDFAVLLSAGYTRRRALTLNLISGGGSVVGAILGYRVLAGIAGPLPYVLGASCASFLYIALADLFPALHRQTGMIAAVSQTAMLGAGVAVIALLLHALPEH